jgi:hypothetical protein
MFGWGLRATKARVKDQRADAYINKDEYPRWFLFSFRHMDTSPSTLQATCHVVLGAVLTRWHEFAAESSQSMTKRQKRWHGVFRGTSALAAAAR